MAVNDWNATPGLNTSISGINIAEGCAPGNINDAIRQMMADVKTVVATDLPAAYQPKDADLTAIAALTSAANKVPYATGAGTWALADLSVFARTLLDDADAATARTTLGAQASDAALASLAGLSLAAGDVLYATGADTVARLPIGTAGQLLRVNAGATAPEWGASGIAARANFSTTTASGTYSRTGNTVTVTLTGHGMTTGMVALLDYTTGTATDGTYTVTVVDANTFTVTDPSSGATSGNVTRTLFIRSSFNVSSITKNGTGDFTVNFTSALANDFYSWSGSARQAAGTNAFVHGSSVAQTASALRLVVTQAGAGAIDCDTVTVLVAA